MKQTLPGGAEPKRHSEGPLLLLGRAGGLGTCGSEPALHSPSCLASGTLFHSFWVPSCVYCLQRAHVTLQRREVP